MKIGLRLMISFMSFTLVLVAVGLSGIVLSSMTDDLRDEATEKTEQMANINALSAGSCRQYQLAVWYSTIRDDDYLANMTLDEYDSVSENNAAIIDDLEDYYLDDSRFRIPISKLDLYLGYMDETFEDLRDETNATNVTTLLNKYQKYMEDMVVGDDENDKFGLDYLIETIKDDVNEANSEASDLQQTSTVISMAGILLAIFLAFYFAKHLTDELVKPIETFATNSRRVMHEGDLEVVIDLERDDEIGELATVFNHMVNMTKNAYLMLSGQEDSSSDNSSEE